MSRKFRAVALETTMAQRAIKALYLPGQSSIHMANEKPGRQRKILSRIAGLDISVSIYVATSSAFKTQLAARRRCLEELVGDMVAPIT